MVGLHLLRLGTTLWLDPETFLVGFISRGVRVKSFVVDTEVFVVDITFLEVE